MKTRVMIAVAAVVLASGTAYAAQAMAGCCDNCSCCNEKHGEDRPAPAPAPAPQR